MIKKLYFAWAILGLVLLMEVQRGTSDPSPQAEDMLKTLLKLDRMYSSVARPRYIRSGSHAGMVPKVQRAINMLRLHHLDRLYADMSRPRRGDDGEDRMEVYPKVQRDVITLHQLDRMYADLSRPRFGKRGDSPNYPSSAEDYHNAFQNDESRDWLPLRR